MSSHPKFSFAPQELLIPEHDETFYSLCARIAHNSSSSGAVMSQRLLGYRYGSRHPDLTYGLEHLGEIYRQQGLELKLDEMAVRARTVLAGVMPLLIAKERVSLLEAVRRSWPLTNTKRMLSLRGVDTGMTTVLRRCPDCVSSDLQDNGFAYWHAVHQLPGVWICPFHVRPLQYLKKRKSKELTWLVVHRTSDDFDELNVSVSQLERLHSLAAAVVWIASQWSIGQTALSVMVRERLQECGLTALEGLVTDAEQACLHQKTVVPLAAVLPQIFSVFDSPSWVGKTLSLTEFAHPLRWSMLIAATLRETEHLKCLQPGISENPLSTALMCTAPEGLDSSYARALLRLPQQTLFPDRRGPRRQGAPERLYAALSAGVRISVAAELSGMSVNTVRIWLRKDQALARHWHSSIARLRTKEAVRQIKHFLSQNPFATRSEVLQAEVSAVRSLERYAPHRLDRLLPAVQAKHSKQLRFTF